MKKGYCYETQIGILCFVEEDDYLIQCTQKVHNGIIQEETPLIKYACHEVLAYLDGNLEKFKTPFKVFGTPFQMAVYNALLTVSYGQTVSYKDIAIMIKNPNAVRAVGGALNKNPLMLFVPCHRVIKHDKSLGGFAGGAELKRYLLNLEQNYKR